MAGRPNEVIQVSNDVGHLVVDYAVYEQRIIGNRVIGSPPAVYLKSCTKKATPNLIRRTYAHPVITIVIIAECRSIRLPYDCNPRCLVWAMLNLSRRFHMLPPF